MVTGKERTVHRNLLLPVSFLLRDDDVDPLSDSLPVGIGSDHGAALPHDLLDSDTKMLDLMKLLTTYPVLLTQ